MTIFDYLVLFILLASIVISIMRGLVKEVLSLLSWIVALTAANAYGVALAGMLPHMIPGYMTRLIAAFVIVFIVVKLLMWLLMMAVESVVNAGGLSVVDRCLGGLFGMARGVVIIMVTVLLCGMTAIPQQSYWKNALLSPLMVSMTHTVMPFLPGSVVKHVKF